MKKWPKVYPFLVPEGSYLDPALEIWRRELKAAKKGQTLVEDK